MRGCIWTACEHGQGRDRVRCTRWPEGGGGEGQARLSPPCLRRLCACHLELWGQAYLDSNLGSSM